MTAFVQALSWASARAKVKNETLNALAIFSCAGLVLSLAFALTGLDLGPGAF
jgi:hypothetical protein